MTGMAASPARYRVFQGLRPTASRIGLLAILILPLLPSSALAAMEFFSLNENAVIMYDAPSLKADKLYVASRNLPVEAIVKVEGWVKVRDSEGTLAWVEEKALS